jgi:hypothetical protein
MFYSTRNTNRVPWGEKSGRDGVPVWISGSGQLHSQVSLPVSSPTQPVHENAKVDR